MMFIIDPEIRALTASNVMEGFQESAYRKGNPAEWMYERLVRHIIKFEKQLSQDEEIGGRLVAAPGEDVFHIDDIEYSNPDVLIFSGKNQHGRPVRLLQHHSQLSILLTALPKALDTPRRIGFQLEKRQTSTTRNSDELDKTEP